MKILKGITYFEVPRIEETGLAVHGFLGRLGGVSKDGFRSLNFTSKEGDKGENVKKNREIWGDAFNVDSERLLTVNQIHSDRILVLKEEVSKRYFSQKLDYDAIITGRRGIFIGVLTADCLPIILFDPQREVAGIVHAGWRGTFLKIAYKTAREIFRTFGGSPQDLLAGLGPAIGICCFEIDRPLADSFQSSHADSSLFMRPGKNRKWTLDLNLINRAQLIEAGVPGENIFLVGICSSCNDTLFFSHRRDKAKTGRQLSFIGVK